MAKAQPEAEGGDTAGDRHPPPRAGLERGSWAPGRLVGATPASAGAPGSSTGPS